MPSNSARDGAQTATIVQFPVGGRAGLMAKRASAERAVETPAVSYASWYHDEAIREAAETRRPN